MIRANEISNGASGALSMAKSTDQWAERFDMSAEQVFKSFWAFFLAIPAHLVAVEGTRRLIVNEPTFQGSVAGPGVTAFTETSVFLIAWGVELALLVSLANRRGVGWRISPLIIGYNWSVFLSRMAQGLALAAAILIKMPIIATMGILVAGFFSIWLQWGVLRRSLQTTPLGTVGVMGLLVIVYFGISTLMMALYQIVGIVPAPVVPQ